MSSATILVRIGLVALVLAALPATAFAGSKGPGYQTALAHWTAATDPALGAFAGSGVVYQNGKLMFNLATAVDETDPGGMYNGGVYQVGEADRSHPDNGLRVSPRPLRRGTPTPPTARGSKS